MTWWQRLWRRKQIDEQLDKELRFHFDEHTAVKFPKPVDAAHPGETGIIEWTPNRD